MAKRFETGFKLYPFEFKIWPQLHIWPEPWPSSTPASYILPSRPNVCFLGQILNRWLIFETLQTERS